MDIKRLEKTMALFRGLGPLISLGVSKSAWKLPLLNDSTATWSELIAGLPKYVSPADVYL